MILGNKEDIIKKCKDNGDTVLEVTTKQIYIIPKGYTSASIKDLKIEWFETYANRIHAFKDSSLVHGSNEIINIKEL